MGLGNLLKEVKKKFTVDEDLRKGILSSEKVYRQYFSRRNHGLNYKAMYVYNPIKAITYFSLAYGGIPFTAIIVGSTMPSAISYSLNSNSELSALAIPASLLLPPIMGAFSVILGLEKIIKFDFEVKAAIGKFNKEKRDYFTNYSSTNSA